MRVKSELKLTWPKLSINNNEKKDVKYMFDITLYILWMKKIYSCIIAVLKDNNTFLN